MSHRTVGRKVLGIAMVATGLVSTAVVTASPAEAFDGTYPITVEGQLPDAIVGQAYSAQIPVVGGTAPYTFTVTQDYEPLPIGLSMSSTGLVTGIPLVPSYNATGVVVSDSSNPTEYSDPLSAITIEVKTNTSLDPTLVQTGGDLLSRLYASPASLQVIQQVLGTVEPLALGLVDQTGCTLVGKPFCP